MGFSLNLPEIPGFIIKKYLGRGRRGRTYEVIRESSATQPNPKIFILKAMSSYNYTNWVKIATKLKEEAAIVKEIKSPYIVELMMFKVTEQLSYWVFEYCPLGSLRDYIIAMTPRKLRPSEKQLSKWLIELLSGLKYLHDKGIFHGDLRPDCIMMQEDFSLKIGAVMPISRVFLKRNRLTENGRAFYSAPELLVNEGFLGGHSDIFSLGAILYECASLTKPFPDCYALGLFKSTGNLPQLPSNLAANFRDIISQCLKRDPTERPTISGLLNNSYVKQLSASIVDTPAEQVVQPSS